MLQWNSNIVGKILQLMLFGLIQNQVEGEVNTQECSNLGFGSQLMCGSCSLLPQFNLTELQSDCLECCQDEAEEDGTKYVRGADPVIKLLDENKEVKETLSISKWNTDSVEEFLTETLVR